MYYLPHYDVFGLLCFVMNRLDGSIREFLPPQDPGRPKSTGAHKTTRKPGQGRLGLHVTCNFIVRLGYC